MEITYGHERVWKPGERVSVARESSALGAVRKSPEARVAEIVNA